ncbi:cation:proton antiporter domain-containing protein [Microbacterium sp. F1-18]
MPTTVLLVIGLALFVWALWSRLFRRASVNGPIVMTAIGLVAGALLPTQNLLFMESKVTLVLAEIVLAYLLFVDALDVRGSLRSQFTGVPARLLGIGLPLSLLLVLAVGLILPLGLSIAVILAIACIAVPADFAPETSLVRDSRVPARVRRWLSVESGYNDGLVSPLLLGALAFASAGDTGDAGRAFAVAAPAGLIAIVVGGLLGLAIGATTRFADERGWTEAQSMRIAFVAAPVIVFAAAVMLHGNGFVAVFVAGFVIRLTRGASGIPRAELALLEDLSWLANLLLWLAFGFAAIILLSETYDWWPAIVLALVALTVGRFVPVALALRGSNATAKERFFIAAMGPRGAASIVFGLIAANALPGEDGFLVLAATCMVVLGSVVLHGIGGPLLVRRLWGPPHPDHHRLSKVKDSL